MLTHICVTRRGGCNGTNSPKGSGYIQILYPTSGTVAQISCYCLCACNICAPTWLFGFPNCMISRINPTIHQFLYHNAPFCNRNVHTCTFLLQYDVLWDICRMHCVIVRWTGRSHLLIRHQGQMGGFTWHKQRDMSQDWVTPGPGWEVATRGEEINREESDAEHKHCTGGWWYAQYVHGGLKQRILQSQNQGWSLYISIIVSLNIMRYFHGVKPRINQHALIASYSPQM